MQHWHALFTKPRCEFRVADILHGRGLQVFVPTLEYHGKTGNLLDKPFFPRYIFARFDWESDGFASVQWTPGLTRIVTFDGKPAWLPDGDIAYLNRELEVLDGDEFLRLKPGERVRVTDGPFNELEAVFAGYMNGEARAAILLDILGRQTRVVLPAAEVERIPG